MPVLMRFCHVFGGLVQFLDRVLMVVDGFLPFVVNMGMRMLVRMGVLVFVGVNRPIVMSVLVAVAMGVNVLMGMFMFDLGRHGFFLLFRILCPTRNSMPLPGLVKWILPIPTASYWMAAFQP